MAVVEYSNEATGLYNFDLDQSPNILKLLPDVLFPMRGHTCTEKGLLLAKANFEEHGECGYSPRNTCVFREGLLMDFLEYFTASVA